MGACLQDFAVVPKSTCWKQPCTRSCLTGSDSCSLFYGVSNSEPRGRGPFLCPRLSNVHVLSHFCDLRLTSDLKEQAEEELEEEVCLPGLSARLLSRGKSLSESQVVSPQNTQGQLFSCAGEFWQSLQMQGGLRRSVQSKGWAGEESWQEEIPQKKSGSNTNARITKPCSAAEPGQSGNGIQPQAAQHGGRGEGPRSRRFCLPKQPDRRRHTAAC